MARSIVTRGCSSVSSNFNQAQLAAHPPAREHDGCDRQVIVLPAYGFGHGGEGDDSEARKNSQGRDLMDANVKATVSGGRLVDMMLKFKGCTCL